MSDSILTEVIIKKKKHKSEPTDDPDCQEPKAKKSKKEHKLDPESESNAVKTKTAELDSTIKSNEENVEDIKNKISWEILITRCQPIANPIATKKQGKKIFKLIIQANKKKQLRKGVREVQKFIRKGEKGIVILAGDTSPIDVISHLPIVCEDNSIPYCYVPSKEDLGAVCGTKRQTCCMLIKYNEDYAKIYNKLYEDIKLMPLPI